MPNHITTPQEYLQTLDALLLAEPTALLTKQEQATLARHLQGARKLIITRFTHEATRE